MKTHIRPLLLSAVLLARFSGAQAPFSDKDEGSMGPQQDANEGKVVFSHSPIEKKDVGSPLITESRLDQPVYVRSYQPMTPARAFFENEQTCAAQRRFLKFVARLAGTEKSAELYVMPLGDATFLVNRSKTITTLDGKDLVSIVPTAPFELNGGQNPTSSAFVRLAADFKPGKNPVTVSLLVGCEASPGKNGKEFTALAEGTITFVVGAKDLAAFAKKVGPRVRPSLDPENEKRLRPRFVKGLAQGASVISFAADAPRVEPLVSKTSDVRVITRNADGTCGYLTGKWVETWGGGTFDTGRFDSAAVEDPLPCP